jgi:uncharacterized protein YbaP (TraB family)
MFVVSPAIWAAEQPEAAQDSKTGSVGYKPPGLFWSISGDQGQVGYLLGTIHSEDPRVLEYTESFLEHLRGSQVFAMELVPDLPTLNALTYYMRLPEGEDLASLIGESRYQAVAAALKAYSVPAGQVARMKPWAAMMTLSVPPPRTGLFMDFSLSLRASGNGLQVVGLETLEQQLAFLENMSRDQQIMLLDHAVAEFGQVAAVHLAMVNTYLENDLGQLQAMTTEQMLGLDEATRKYFMEQGIDARNHRMLESLLPHFDKGKVFVAVGALHLPGPQGLVALLRSQGYLLQPLPPPFATSAQAAQR